MNTNRNDKRAAIICHHIAKERLPILRAVRSEPLEPEDSGWQFVCASGKEENEENAEVWLIDEILKYEPTLVAFIDSPVGTKVWRSSPTSPWETSA
jgi:hypothetical protein